MIEVNTIMFDTIIKYGHKHQNHAMIIFSLFNIKKIILLKMVICLLTTNVNAQKIGSENNFDKNKQYSKHEIGFSVGAFPTFGYPPKENVMLDFFGLGEYGLPHTSYKKYEDGKYVKMYHLGSYSLNYDYHFNSKHAIGALLSWMGRHVEKYSWVRGDTINGSGWIHYFTLQLNYRNTFYHKDKISLYFGIYCGTTLCTRDKNILYEETHHFLFSSESNDQYYFDIAVQATALGIDIGTKHIFNMELGYGTQGIFKAGYKYKF